MKTNTPIPHTWDIYRNFELTPTNKIKDIYADKEDDLKKGTMKTCTKEDFKKLEAEEIY